MGRFLSATLFGTKTIKFVTLFCLSVVVVVGLLAQPAPADDAAINRQVSGLKTELEARLGYRFTVPIQATSADYYQARHTASDGHYARTLQAVADPRKAPSDPTRWLDLVSDEAIEAGVHRGVDLPAAQLCLIVLADRWVDLSDATLQRSMLVHEMYHCYQNELLGDRRLPLWFQEGSATWAGESFVGGSAFTARPLPGARASLWRQYLSNNAVLSDRAYNAMGLFFHLQHLGVNLWRDLDGMYRGFALSTNPYASLEQLLSTTDRTNFLQTWAMGLERSASAAEWNTSGAAITADSRGHTPLPLTTSEAGAGLNVPPTAHGLFDINMPSGQIVEVVVDDGYGGLRWGEGATTRVTPGFGQQYCVGDTCQCPDGSSPPGVVSVDSGRGLLAVTAAPTASLSPDSPRAFVAAIQIESPCEEEEEEAPTSMPGGGDTGDRASGTSYGDPHIITYDGYRYSFQTVGEFLLTESQDGHFVVQARQIQVPGRSISLNSAVALKVGDHRVAIYAQGAPDGRSPLWIDGVPTALDRGTLALAQGGAITKRGDRHYTVDLPTGEQVAILGIRAGGSDFLNITPWISRNRQQGQFVGLLGDFNGNATDDLRSRNGQVVPSQNAYAPITQLVTRAINIPLPLNQLQTAFFEQLYRQFGDSWRVAQADSLFDYAPGESTETFTDRAFPNQFPSLLGVAPERIRAATQTCQDTGIESRFLEGCVFDVAATGESGFAQAALNAVAEVVVQEVRDRVEDEVRDRLDEIIPIPLPGRFPF
ncbi:MAG: hypothetical protein HC800_20125 [Phormidesmis sp. RL_2_1]|nr:hypothetical protein [Phormidesmis sp. RL_2_1]